MKLARVLEGAAVLLAALAVAFGAIALLSGFFTGRDQAGLGGAVVPGTAFADLGHAHLTPGQPHPRYDSNPPTSGAHAPASVGADNVELSDDQLLEALELGDVVVMYGTPTPPPGLRALARSTAAPFTPALAAAGQAVILARRSGIDGVVGLAWAHMARVAGPGDPLLRAFIDYWLGRGAPQRLAAP